MFCSKCGSKLRTNAKFCTVCGQKMVTRSKFNPQYKVETKRIPVKKRSNKDIKNLSPSYQRYSTSTEPRKASFSKPISIPSKAKSNNTQQKQKKLVEGNIENLKRNFFKILIDIENLERKINNKTPDIILKAMEIQLRYADNMLEIKDKFISQNKSILEPFLNNTTWKSLLKLDLFKEEVEEEQPILESLYISTIFVDKIYSSKRSLFKRITHDIFSEFKRIKASENYLTSLKVQQNTLSVKLFSKLPKDLTITQAYKTLLHEEFTIKNNVDHIENIINLLREIQSRNSEIERTLNNTVNYGTRNLFKGKTLELSNYHFGSFVNNCISNQDNLSEMNLWVQAIFVDKELIIPEFKFEIFLYIMISEVLKKKTLYLARKLFQKFILAIDELIDPLETILKNEKLDHILISKKIEMCRNEILNPSTKTRTDLIFKGRYSRQVQLSVKYSSLIDLTFDNFLQLFSNSYRSNYFSILRIIQKKKEKQKENINQTTRSNPIITNSLGLNNSDQSMVTEYHKEMKNLRSILSVSALPKLSTMSSLFLRGDKNDPISDIRREFESISYNFKRIYYDSDTKISCKLNSNNIKYIDWEFSEDSIICHVDWEFVPKNDVVFTLKKEKDTKKFSYFNPYKGIEIKFLSNSPKLNDMFLRRLKKEKRVAEKLKLIPGLVLVSVKNDFIEITTSRNPKMINLIFEFVKELTFILNLSFKY